MNRIIYGDILVSGFRVGSFSWDAGGIMEVLVRDKGVSGFQSNLLYH